jgi:hypothetical protein
MLRPKQRHRRRSFNEAAGSRYAMIEEGGLFSKSVSDRLQYYVYRLIDPRNGETFYVGKGLGNRVFSHVAGELAAGDDVLSEKVTRIREIRNSGFEVAHVIHRHGMDEDTAFEVEAALIDAYPEVTNIAGGRASDERGVMHSRQVIEQYEAQPATFRHPVVLISINRSAAERSSPYEAVRYAWKINPANAAKCQYVLAVEQGIIIGAYVADRWMEATPENFPGTAAPRPGRWGFTGRDAAAEIHAEYVRKRIPDHMRRKGAANPVKYATPSGAIEDRC